MDLIWSVVFMVYGFGLRWDQCVQSRWFRPCGPSCLALPVAVHRAGGQRRSLLANCSLGKRPRTVLAAGSGRSGTRSHWCKCLRIQHLIGDLGGRSPSTPRRHTPRRGCAEIPSHQARAPTTTTRSVDPVSRRCRFLTIVGVNEASTSRGTSISTGPISVDTVLDRTGTVAGVAPVPAHRSCLSNPRGSLISASSAVSRTRFVSWLNSPFGPPARCPSPAPGPLAAQ